MHCRFFNLRFNPLLLWFTFSSVIKYEKTCILHTYLKNQDTISLKVTKQVISAFVFTIYTEYNFILLILNFKPSAVLYVSKQSVPPSLVRNPTNTFFFDVAWIFHPLILYKIKDTFCLLGWVIDKDRLLASTKYEINMHLKIKTRNLGFKIFIIQVT